jgi:hypothetical protein
MSDITTAAATTVGAAAGAITLAQWGIDPVAIGFGAVGAIVAQSLLRKGDDGERPWRTLIVMLGSTLFAGGAAPAVSLSVGGQNIPTAYHALIALLCGMCAQPLAQGFRRVAVLQGGRLMTRIFGGDKSEGKSGD